MKKNIYLCFFPVFIVACSNYIEHSNRIDFTISDDQRIIVPVRLNDNITANMMFDSGAVDGVFRLDSSFVAAHPSLVPDACPDVKPGGLAGYSVFVPIAKYDTSTTITIGATALTYNQLYILNWRKYVQSDGIFNMPKNDTTHVWEWNFEHNYLEIHSEENFKMPKNSYICPIEKKGYYAYYIRLPLRIKYADGDTLLIDQQYLVDTGLGSDVALYYPATEQGFFNKKKDAVRFIHFRRYTVTATLFDDFVIDLLRVYTHEYSLGSDQYLVGLNFLKRFNVFFDRKHQVIGLQPIKNFRRAVLKNAGRFHYSTSKNLDGKCIVTDVASYFKAAGLQIGDEIVVVNGKPYKDITWEEEHIDFYKKDTLFFDVFRNGKPLKIVIPVDKDENQDD